MNHCLLAIPTSILITALCGYFGCLQAHSAEPPNQSREFSLTCKVEGPILKCTLRNTSTKTIRYSNYTIGYHEAIMIERYDDVSKTWHRVQLRDSNTRAINSAGASDSNVRSVDPGAIIPPAQRLKEPPTFSFIVPLRDYILPKDKVLHLRVTQEMGTMLRSNLSVWKGKVVSKSLIFRQHEVTDDDKKESL